MGFTKLYLEQIARDINCDADVRIAAINKLDPDLDKFIIEEIAKDSLSDPRVRIVAVNMLTVNKNTSC